VLLQTASVQLKPGRQTISLTAVNTRARAVRLQFNAVAISLARLEINYSNGQTHFENRTVTLRPGERSRPFDERDGELPIEALTLEIGSMPGDGRGIATVEVWGLRQAVSTSPPTSQQPAPKLRPRGAPDDESTRLAAQKRGYFEVPVFFGTTRVRSGERQNNSRSLVKFGNDQPRPLTLTLGRAVVTVPYDRQPGSIQRPETDLIITRIAFRREDPTRDFTIAEAAVLSSAELVSQMKRQIAGAKRFKDQALVFVHGYNVSFDDAIFRTAQIAKDIEFDGPAVAFSWRSAGGMWDYRHDIDTAKESRVALRDLLTLIARDTGVTNVNLIAHSMGNDPVIEVLRENAEIRRAGGRPQDLKLNEIVLASPDVARDVFTQFAGAFSGIAKGGITLYASSNDRALVASKRVASGLVRAGEIPKEGILVLPGIESIDITEANTGFFSTNHSTFADRRHLIDDMGLLFERTSNKRPPNVRFPVYKAQGRAPSQWWQYRN
jgi:esterase/lipase superfamily enzyme